ncbi:MAG: UDP-N-acetylmuramoyl-L-alanyl-D-glutamate--2,6-diaminopimelate ligase [Actinobacteria bacterium]|nr:UDP-N-acetylmuramoyl-L-alanyl-D-glutamate--2,6-diaminopimelate ligase [Actinomycetota bacterium]
MHLHELLRDIDVLELAGDEHADVVAIEHDSRRVLPGALFCAIRGETTDGHAHVPEALDRGAVALLVDRSITAPATLVRVAEVRRAIGPVSVCFFAHPSKALPVLGVTGTNGKTTVTYLLESIGRAAGVETGVIGTTGTRIGTSVLPTGRTTPEAPELQELLARMRDAGVLQVAMEVSSHALAMHRVDGTHFAAVCFTNLSHDHLDLHGSLESYFATKARLFAPELASAAAIATDDPWGTRLAGIARTQGLPVTTFGLGRDADVRAEALVPDRSGTRFRLVLPAGEADVFLPLLGEFNVANALAAAATSTAIGRPVSAIAAGLGAVGPVPGRMERVDRGQPFTVLVDYAHTPDALRRAVAEARRLAAGHRVIVVFGCGGDKDRAKRPLMGRVASVADLVLLTSDNPRNEDPTAIAAEVEAGLRDGSGAFRVELDRRTAIRAALGDATAGDVVVVAGKGHETGQVVGARSQPFDDRVVAGEELEALAWT